MTQCENLIRSRLDPILSQNFNPINPVPHKGQSLYTLPNPMIKGKEKTNIKRKKCLKLPTSPTSPLLPSTAPG